MSLSIALNPWPRIYKCMAGISPAVFILLGAPTGVETKRGQAQQHNQHGKESPLRRMVRCVRGIKLTGGLPSGTLEDAADDIGYSA
jgi:hypothetical protein